MFGNHLFFVDKNTGLLTLTEEGKEIFDENMCCEHCGISLLILKQYQDTIERLEYENKTLAANILESRCR